MTKKKQQRQECYIIWDDSIYVDADLNDSDIEEKELIHTKGWLMKTTKRRYIVAQEIDPKSKWHRRTTSIPKCSVAHIDIWDTDIWEEK